MDLVTKLNLVWFLSLCVLTAARNIQKLEEEPLSEAATATNALRTPSAYIIEPVKTLAKASHNSIAPTYGEVESGEGIKLNEIGSKTEDAKPELFTIPHVKISDSIKETGTSAQNEQKDEIVKESDLKLIESEKIPTKTRENERKSENISEISLPKASEDVAKSKLRSLTNNLETNKNTTNLIRVELKLDSERILNNENNIESFKYTNAEEKFSIPLATDNLTKKTEEADNTLETTEKILLKNVNSLGRTNLADALDTKKEESSIQSKIINTYDVEKEILEKIILKEENKKTLDTEKIIFADGDKKGNNLESSTAFTTTGLPPLEKIQESDSQTVKEQLSYKPITNNEEKISENLKKTNENLTFISLNIPVIATTKSRTLLNSGEDAQKPISITGTTKANSIDVKETRSNQVVLENDQKNLRATTNLNAESSIALTATPLTVTPPQTLSISTYPATTGITSTLQANRPITTTTITNRPGTYPAWLPNFSILPPVPLLPNFLWNPLNTSLSANNQMQSTFGLGILGTPANWRQNFSNLLALNPFTETRPPLTDAISTFSELRDFQTGKIVKLTDDKITNAALAQNAVSSGELPKLNLNKTEAPVFMRGYPQVLHLFFPLKYVYPKQVVAETAADKNDAVAKERKIALGDIKNQVNEPSGAAGESASDHVKAKSDEGTSLIFKLDLPKPVVHFVRGVLDTFKPLVQN